MLKFIFSDVDGTLVHKSNKHSNLIQLPEENRYISRHALNLLKEIKNKAPITIITGRRLSGYQRLSNIIPHNYAIIEHGCVILDQGKPDQDWADIVKDVVGIFGCYQGPLWDYVRIIEKQGYKTDYNGRIASVRVFLDKPDNLTEEEKVMLEEKVIKEVGTILITTRNQEMLDIIPKSGGKINASYFLLSKYGLEAHDALVLGDDLNDEDMLRNLGFPLCPGNALHLIKKLVEQRKGYVSQHNDHEGTIDMLKEVFRHV